MKNKPNIPNFPNESRIKECPPIFFCVQLPNGFEMNVSNDLL